MAIEISGDVRHSVANPDYLIIGTPGRKGELKVTFNLDEDVEVARAKVRKGIAVLDMAYQLLTTPPKPVEQPKPEPEVKHEGN